MKRTLVLFVIAALLPIAAVAQVESAPAAPPPKYELFLGMGYTRIRQVPLSYSGLVGGKATLSRDWGRYFQLNGSVDYYRIGSGHSYIPNRGDVSAYTFLIGPGVHLDITSKLTGMAFAELGGEHTGGEHITPKISFAGGFGGGLAYGLTHNLAVQLTGDRVAASFSLPNNNPQLAYSTNKTWNARGTIGIVYRFQGLSLPKF